MFGKLNDAYDSVKNGLEIEVKLATADQRNQLANAKMSLADLKMLMADLREENENLKAQLNTKDQVLSGEDCYVKTLPDGREYAVCSHCWEVDKLAVTLVHDSGFRPSCPKCKNYFPDIPQNNGYINIKR